MNQFDNEVSSTLKEIAERVETPPYLKDRIDNRQYMGFIRAFLPHF